MCVCVCVANTWPTYPSFSPRSLDVSRNLFSGSLPLRPGGGGSAGVPVQPALRQMRCHGNPDLIAPDAWVYQDTLRFRLDQLTNPSPAQRAASVARAKADAAAAEAAAAAANAAATAAANAAADAANAAGGDVAYEDEYARFPDPPRSKAFSPAGVLGRARGGPGLRGSAGSRADVRPADLIALALADTARRALEGGVSGGAAAVGGGSGGDVLKGGVEGDGGGSGGGDGGVGIGPAALPGQLAPTWAQVLASAALAAAPSPPESGCAGGASFAASLPAGAMTGAVATVGRVMRTGGGAEGDGGGTGFGGMADQALLVEELQAMELAIE